MQQSRGVPLWRAAGRRNTAAFPEFAMLIALARIDPTTDIEGTRKRQPMYLKVSLAGLPEELAKRTRIAFNLQAAHGCSVGYVNGLGLPADMLVIDADSKDAKVVMERALQAGRKVLAFGHAAGIEHGVTVLKRDTPVTELGNLFRAEIDRLRERRDPVDGAPRRRGVPVIVRLASGGIDARANLKLVSGDLTLIIRRGASRVLAPSHSDILVAAERLMTTDWKVEVLTSFDIMSVRGWMSRSLDSFLVRAVRARGVVLPRFPDTPVRLHDWPDLAECNDPLAVEMAGLMSRGLVTIDRLVEYTGAGQIDVCNLLWAFRAAGLLTVSATTPVRRPTPPTSQRQHRASLLTRIARRIGMGFAVP
ncbi:hypothetical protein [Pseudofulvimonas gallinarii]